jgi:aprataxin
MHVISQDFDSPSLKTKKHWNSFTSAFFVDAHTFLDKLKKEGAIKVRALVLTERMFFFFWLI